MYQVEDLNVLKTFMQTSAPVLTNHLVMGWAACMEASHVQLAIVTLWCRLCGWVKSEVSPAQFDI